MLSEPIYYNDDDLDPEDRPTEQQKIEALYDPLEDDENEGWIHKNYRVAGKKPLVCPNCFSQVAYEYEILKNNQYSVVKPLNIVVLQTKVIRNK